MRSNPRAKCADCPAREFIPINDQAIAEHFKGERDSFREVSGIAETLSNAGCEVMVNDAPLTGIVVFDGKVAWCRDAAAARVRESRRQQPEGRER